MNLNSKSPYSIALPGVEESNLTWDEVLVFYRRWSREYGRKNIRVYNDVILAFQSYREDNGLTDAEHDELQAIE